MGLSFGVLKLFVGGIVLGFSVPAVLAASTNPLYVAGLLAGLLCVLKGGVATSNVVF